MEIGLITRVATILLTVAAAVPAVAQVPRGDPAAGAGLAETWCASCHALAPGAARSEVAPAFPEIAVARTPVQIAAFLAQPHGRMPPLALSRKEIADLTAYIAVLAPEATPPAGPDGLPADERALLLRYRQLTPDQQQALQHFLDTLTGP